MSRPPIPTNQPAEDGQERPPRGSSRQRYRSFVADYRARRLDERLEQASAPGKDSAPAKPGRAKRRQYVREYLRWLKPHRYAVGGLFLIALAVAGLQMIEPL